MASSNPLDAFNWTPQPQARKLIDELIGQFLSALPPAQDLARRMCQETGTRFYDWVDYIHCPRSEALTQSIEDAGFVLQPVEGGEGGTGEWGNGGMGEGERGRKGDKETRGQGDKEADLASPRIGNRKTSNENLLDPSPQTLDPLSSSPSSLRRSVASSLLSGSALSSQTYRCYVHPEGIFPRIVLGEGETMAVAIKVESVADFAVAWQLEEPVIGQPLAALRMVRVFQGQGAELWALERHGDRGLEVRPILADQVVRILKHAEAFRRRKRNFDDEQAGFAQAEALIDAAIAEVGVDRACDLFFAAEREYWQGRNHAAQVQKRRQDRLGLGWANHDHHTYRSSRRHFARLIGLFEKLGLRPRERFYAGREAGWGAQVMEQPQAGIVVFADVDLSADELYGDFAHEGLEESKELGTVGLWCGLHGEAFLQAGMHHLECQFDFDALKEQLEQEAGVKTMKPFTDLAYLRQAFTEGERWPVDPRRIAVLLDKGQITPEQARQFAQAGAIGSHLENLERNEGFKGFNQKGVSQIISATDPRKQGGAMGKPAGE